MPPRPSTVADLRRTGAVSSLEIVAAIDRYMHNPTAGPYRFNSGHSVDIAAAVAASALQSDLQARPGPQQKTLRQTITVIVMAAGVMGPEPER